jgi:hypothetical protein
MAALVQDFHIEQNADWPGMAFWIVDAAGNPKSLSPSMTVDGAIVYGGARVFEWSSTPTPEQGPVLFAGSTLIPTVLAAQSALWAFTNAPYELYLTDPAAPPADRRTRVGKGTVYLSRSLG